MALSHWVRPEPFTKKIIFYDDDDNEEDDIDETIGVSPLQTWQGQGQHFQEWDLTIISFEKWK